MGFALAIVEMFCIIMAMAIVIGGCVVGIAMLLTIHFEYIHDARKPKLCDVYVNWKRDGF